MIISRNLALVLALSTVPAVAQVRGSINQDAPTVTHALQFKNQAKVEVSYTALRFGTGNWQKVLENTAGHERFNKFAASRPMGSVSTTSAISASGRIIPAGEYDLYFTAFSRDGNASWLLNLKNKADDSADLIRFRLALKDTDVDHSRMTLALEPGYETGSMNLTIAFGKQSVTVGLSLSDGAPPKEAASKPSKTGN